MSIFSDVKYSSSVLFVVAGAAVGSFFLEEASYVS